jgi:hypothetical protein
VVQNPFCRLSFTSVAAGFALFTADLSAAPWLGHAVSFPFTCTENIRATANRLANAHYRRRVIGSMAILSCNPRTFFWRLWHADG